MGDVRELARAHTTDALEAIAAIARDAQQPGRARVAAAVALLDRGWGKPPIQADVRADVRAGVIVVPGMAGSVEEWAAKHSDPSKRKERLEALRARRAQRMSADELDAEIDRLQRIRASRPHALSDHARSSVVGGPEGGADDRD